METNEKDLRIKSLARDIVRLSRNTLLVDMRFLDTALSMLPDEYWSRDAFAVDGKRLIFNEKRLLRCYKSSPQSPARCYLHMVLHCVFRHMYSSSGRDPFIWDLACDMAVENSINSLGLKALKTPEQDAQSVILAEFSDVIKNLSAEKLYQYYANKELTRAQAEEIRNSFFCDDHSGWYYRSSEEDEEASEEACACACSPSLSKPGGSSGLLSGLPTEPQPMEPDAEQEELWARISERMEIELGSFAKEQGDTAGGLMQNLLAVNRRKYDYSAFLKKFAVAGEAMKLNPDEFDYIYYTYGLQLYKNVPLIEALEYKDVKKIKDFVIAIDTSGSTSGELVQKFIEKTFNILQSTESFFTAVNVHIIQCDAQIQEHVKISDKEQFEEYLKTMTLKGMGGTDFRPVFTLVDRLIKEGEFDNLKGLIYFTDGYGEFPAKKPAYDTAFVFVEDDYNNPQVPGWAIKLVLQKDEI